MKVLIIDSIKNIDKVEILHSDIIAIYQGQDFYIIKNRIDGKKEVVNAEDFLSLIGRL